MRFDADSRTRIYADVILDYDPSNSTVELQVETSPGVTVWYPATWQSSPVFTDGRWTQTALSDDYFSGPLTPDPTPPLVAIRLAVGRHNTQVRVTSGDQIVSHDASPIDVR